MPRVREALASPLPGQASPAFRLAALRQICDTHRGQDHFLLLHRRPTFYRPLAHEHPPSLLLYDQTCAQIIRGATHSLMPATTSTAEYGGFSEQRVGRLHLESPVKSRRLHCVSNLHQSAKLIRLANSVGCSSLRTLGLGARCKMTSLQLLDKDIVAAARNGAHRIIDPCIIHLLDRGFPLDETGSVWIPLLPRS